MKHLESGQDAANQWQLHGPHNNHAFKFITTTMITPKL